MSDFRMDESRPINNNSGAMKAEDIITNIDRRPGHQVKVIVIEDDNPIKLGGQLKSKTPEFITKVKE